MTFDLTRAIVHLDGTSFESTETTDESTHRSFDHTRMTDRCGRTIAVRDERSVRRDERTDQRDETIDCLTRASSQTTNRSGRRANRSALGTQRSVFGTQRSAQCPERRSQRPNRSIHRARRRSIRASRRSERVFAPCDARGCALAHFPRCVARLRTTTSFARTAVHGR